MESKIYLRIFALAGILLLALTGCSRQADHRAVAASQPSTTQAHGAASLDTPTSSASAPNVSQTATAGPGQVGAPLSSPPVSAADSTTDATAPKQSGATGRMVQDKTPPPTPAPPRPKSFQLPAGTRINIRTITAISTKTSKTGDPFRASLTVPLIVRGVVVAPKGAEVAGAVVNSDPGGRIKGVASLTLQIQAIRSVDGQTIPVHTSSFVQQAKTTKKRDAMRTGIAAGAGALIGAIAGGGKGAAIGAGVGGGAGVATNMATRGAAAELPAESVLEFTLAESARITEIRPGSLAQKR